MDETTHRTPSRSRSVPLTRRARMESATCKLLLGSRADNGPRPHTASVPGGGKIYGTRAGKLSSRFTATRSVARTAFTSAAKAKNKQVSLVENILKVKHWRPRIRRPSFYTPSHAVIAAPCARRSEVLQVLFPEPGRRIVVGGSACDVWTETMSLNRRFVLGPQLNPSRMTRSWIPRVSAVTVSAQDFLRM